MPDNSILEKKTWSTKDAVYLVGGVIAFYIQFVALKTAIHDEITQRMADKQVIEYRLDALERNHTSSLPVQIPPDHYYSAILPVNISLITSRKFRKT